MRLRFALLGALALLAGCSASSSDAPGCEPARTAPDGTCLPAPCAGDAVWLEGACHPVGVDRCAEGFASVPEGGCAPVLPACPPDAFAFPGTACAPLDPCAAGRFAGSGDAIYVDASAVGGDGTEARPLSTVAAGLAAAKASGKARLYVAKGRYAERIVVNTPIEIVGACSAATELVAPDGDLDKTTVHVVADARLVGLRVTGKGHAVGVGTQGSATLRLSGVRVSGHDVGVEVPRIASPKVPTLGLDRVRIEDARVGVTSYVTLEASRVSIAHVDSGLDLLGGGSLDAVVIEDAASEGVLVLGGNTLVRRAVVRDVGRRSGVAGYGVVVDQLPTLPPPSVTVEDSFVGDVVGVALGVQVGTLTVDRTSVQGARPTDSNLGALVMLSEGGVLTVRRSALLHGPMMGFYVTGGALVVEDVVMRDVGTGDVAFGGLFSRPGAASGTMSVRGLFVDQAGIVGVAVVGRDATIAGLRVDRVVPDPRGLFGDALMVAALGTQKAAVGLSDLDVRAASRAGASVFGATLRVRGARVCAQFPFDVSDTPLVDTTTPAPIPAVLEDQGGAVCGCAPPLARCAASQADLVPMPAPPRPSK